jgi:hypothetical protein
VKAEQNPAQGRLSLVLCLAPVLALHMLVAHTGEIAGPTHKNEPQVGVASTAGYLQLIGQ